MSSQQYFVVQANCEGPNNMPQVGQMVEVNSEADGVDKVVELALEQCDTPEAEIRAEVEADGNFADPNRMFTIAVCIPEN